MSIVTINPPIPQGLHDLQIQVSQPSYANPMVSICAPLNGTVVYWAFLELMINISSSYYQDYENTKFPNYADTAKNLNGSTFNFIVVGGGTAGLVIAARIAEICGWTVLVLEAGGLPPLKSNIPLWFSTMQRTEVDWSYKTVEDFACKACKNAYCTMPKGKMLSGCTGMNFMYDVRAEPTRFNWDASDGATGWNFANDLPYFKKLERNKVFTDPEFHNTTGAVCYGLFDHNYPYNNFFELAANERGIPTILDINNGSTVSPCIYRTQMMGTNGRRMATHTAYIEPIKNQKNLFLVLNAYVIKILFKGTKAIGVVYILNGDTTKQYVAYASTEVIISAGSVESPLLLLRSGIGDPAVLKANNIATVVASPFVGQKLKDHAGTILFIKFKNIKTTSGPIDYVAAVIQYWTNRTGWCAGIGSLEYQSLTRSNVTGFVEIQTYRSMQEMNSWQIPEFMRVLDYEDTYNQIIFKANCECAVAIVAVIILNPLSSGYVTLDSGLKMQYNYLKDPKDLTIMINALRVELEMFETETYKNAGAELIIFPPCDKLYNTATPNVYTDEFLTCIIVRFFQTIYHPAGTCGMGRNLTSTNVSDGYVVDETTKVYGAQSLRVCDASIFPIIPWGNLHVSTIMVAEKVADLIKGQYGQLPQPPTNTCPVVTYQQVLLPGLLPITLPPTTIACPAEKRNC